MRKLLLMVFSVLICAQLTGCAGWAVRTSTSKQPRVDQKITGNRGFISGRATSAPKEPAFTERKVYRIEVEMPQFPQKKEPVLVKKKAVRRGKDQVVWGNKGYIFGGPKREGAEELPETYLVPEELQVEKAPALETVPEKTIAVRTYKVRKRDTLQKISRRFYGTTKKWILLYQANKDKLKSPDKLYPGQVLVIPEAAEYKK